MNQAYLTLLLFLSTTSLQSLHFSSVLRASYLGNVEERVLKRKKDFSVEMGVGEQ